MAINFLNDISLAEDGKITIGNDLEINHTTSGGNSYIKRLTNGGNLVIQSSVDNDVILGEDNGSSGTTAYLTVDGSASKVVINATSGLMMGNEYTFPTDDGSADQVLTTDGNGALSWSTVSAGGGGDITGVTLTADDSGTAEDLTTNVNLTIAGGNAISTTATSSTLTINHDDTSSQASVNNSGRTYIQDITLDTYGHVTGITSASESVTNTNTQNTYASSWVDSSNDVLLRLTAGGAGSGTQDIKMVAGDGISLTPSGTNMTIAIRDASGSDKGGILVSSTDASVVPENITTTANRSYQIQTTESGVASVNVPWTDTNTTTTADVKTALGGAIGSNALAIGDSSTVTTFAGNVVLDDGSGASPTMKFINASDNEGTISINSSGKIEIATGGSVRQTISSGDTTFSNKVVVDDISLDAKTLTITGDTSDTFTIVTGAAGATTLTTTDAGGAAGHFEVAADGNITLDAAGGVNIEMSDGDYTAFKNGNNTYAHFFAEDGANTILDMYEKGGESNDDYFRINVGTAGATTLTTHDDTGATAHFEIAADGNITLDAAGNVAIEATTTSVDGILDLTGTTDSSDATGDTGILRCEGGGSIAKKLYVGSTITGSADVIAYSDKRLKENVKTLDGKKVLEMRGVSFDRVDTGKASSGVIAQEMEKVAPELVIDDGNYKGVAYGNIVGYLIEAIKDQQKQINELKEIINGCSK